MRSAIIAITALAISLVSAENIVSITSPLTGMVYKAGSPALISWVNAKVSTIPAIVIARGNPNALEPVSTIAKNVDATAGSYSWNIPADFPAGTEYSFELGTSPNISFSGQFTVQAGSGSSSSASSSSTTSAIVSKSSAPASVSSSSSSSSQASSSSSSAPSSGSSSSASALSESSTSPSTSPSPNAANGKTATTASALAVAMVGSAVMLLA